MVDDLQWCDAPSLRYLAHLLPRIGDLSLLVVAALRTGEPAADERLVQHITADPSVHVLVPCALSAQASEALLRQHLPSEVDPQFAAACFAATGGNPLLVRELARTLAAEAIAGHAAHASKVTELGPPVLARLVSVRLARLPDISQMLAQAVAVLGDHADVRTAAALPGQDTPTALEAAAALERMETAGASNHCAAGPLMLDSSSPVCLVLGDAPYDGRVFHHAPMLPPQTRAGNATPAEWLKRQHPRRS
ncbi:hypothetical protein AB0I54_46710 [Streptomyces sp. NPDC050625]|uniref:hypothetical protein n=1 Tax=Streptomyces sp. NPDC050625 TaxID=3154629 RepID=UPI00341E66C8